MGLGMFPFLHEENLSFQGDVPFYSVSFFLEAGDVGLTTAMVGRSESLATPPRPCVSLSPTHLPRL